MAACTTHTHPTEGGSQGGDGPGWLAGWWCVVPTWLQHGLDAVGHGVMGVEDVVEVPSLRDTSPATPTTGRGFSRQSGRQAGRPWRARGGGGGGRSSYRGQSEGGGQRLLPQGEEHAQRGAQQDQRVHLLIEPTTHPPIIIDPSIHRGRHARTTHSTMQGGRRERSQGQVWLLVGAYLPAGLAVGSRGRGRGP